MALDISAEDMEVARILRMLPHLVWETQHPRPCTHSLRWGRRKRRSAGYDEAQSVPAQFPAASPPPPRAPTAPAPDASVAKATTAEAAPGTSSPETPLDFCPSGEEPDAEAKRRLRVERITNAKKPKSNRRELTKRIELLIHTRTQLQKEAAEARSRLEAERWKHSELVRLRIKLEERHVLRQQQQHLLRGKSCFDPAPTCAVRLIQAPEQPYPHFWPNQWVNAYPVIRQPPPTGFSLSLSPSLDRLSAGPLGEVHHGDWAASPALGGSQSGARPCKIPDLNATADEELSWS